MPFRLTEIENASNRISSYVHRTPVFTSNGFDTLLGDGKHLYFKAECLQKTGSFKARGAINAVSLLNEQNPSLSGVITHSSGNHGQALAYAASQFSIPCTVVVPSNAPKVKVAAIASYGAKMVVCEPTATSRISTCDQVAKETGHILIHPHDNYEVIAGQGTVGLELLSQVPQLDTVLVPVGGGGLAAGIACCITSMHPACKVYCVEPLGKELEASFRAGTPLWPDGPGTIDTVADGMRVLKIGSRCFPELMKTCQPTVLTVTDSEIISAMKLVYERLKLVIEPSAGTTVAAALKYHKQLEGKHLAVILCGGNQDLNHLPWQ